MSDTQKITAHVPVDLLREAQAATGDGITKTICHGLALVAAAKAVDDLRRLRGKVRLDLDLALSRRDRR
jgi:putative intracellular protease/amidase